tara:strand:+ start:1432 stop:1581 length:150 start_codon:yes stop_codon:yes gene_type:complete
MGVHPSGWKRKSARTAEDIVRTSWESHELERRRVLFRVKGITRPFAEQH